MQSSRESFLLGWARRRFKTKFTRSDLDRIRRRWAEPAAVFCSHSLCSLAQIYGSDKWGSHWYAQHYQRHFGHLRRSRITLLEIGIGGYSDPRAGGGSLRMWRKFFPRAQICGIDIEDKSPHNERRIRTFRGDQTDEAFLRRVIAEIGTPDIIIDDGSHVNRHILQTFNILFPLLADHGFYAVEDLCTAYWPDYGGDSEHLGAPTTSMGFLQRLTDGLNHEEFIRPGYRPSYFDQHIVGLHFYHNLAIIQKGFNNEGSPAIKNNLPPA